jgi:hypothetical protein
VLRNYKSDLEWSKKLSLPIFKGCDRLFNENSVNYLNEIVYLTGAEIVITSNWRIKLTFDELKKALKDRGIEGVIKGTTETFASLCKPFPVGNRGFEILRYIQSNKIGKNYVIIDDQIADIIKFFDKEKVVKINPIECLSSKDIDKILDILL